MTRDWCTRLRGQPGPRRRASELRAQVLARHAERYADFGPTLAAEYLTQEGWRVDHETLRRWRWLQGDGPCAGAGNATDNGGNWTSAPCG